MLFLLKRKNPLRELFPLVFGLITPVFLHGSFIYFMAIQIIYPSLRFSSFDLEIGKGWRFDCLSFQNITARDDRLGRARGGEKVNELFHGQVRTLDNAKNGAISQILDVSAQAKLDCPLLGILSEIDPLHLAVHFKGRRQRHSHFHAANRFHLHNVYVRNEKN